MIIRSDATTVCDNALTMKRILFYAENFCGPDSRGGTEIATYRIAKALKAIGGYEVFNAYRNGQGDDVNLYSDIIRLKTSHADFRKQLSVFIKEKDIDVVVNMSRFFRHQDIAEAVARSARNAQIMFMQHFAPGSEFKKPTYKSGLHLLKLNPLNPLYWLRTSLYPLFKYPRNKKLRKLYREIYEISDKVILLSETYKSSYCEVGGFSDTSKFVAVPNIFDGLMKPETGNPEGTDYSRGLKEEEKGHINQQGENGSKEKRVLILSRLDEIQKRLSLALQIWRKIEDDPDLAEWRLDIVGTGHNRDIVERLIKKLDLRRVTMHGWQDRTPFLQRSQIMMMTSEYEGLPLNLLEAQAYGVVPIAFNSFGGLKDIVEEYHDGVIVENFGDVDDYVKKLTELMYDEAYRDELSKNAMKASDKFSSEKIAEKWNRILT